MEWDEVEVFERDNGEESGECGGVRETKSVSEKDETVAERAASGAGREDRAPSVRTSRLVKSRRTTPAKCHTYQFVNG